MGIHLYYMSTGISKPENAATAFASLMRHMRRLQTNQKEWWNTLFLYFDMMFHSVFLIEVIPYNSLPLLALEVFISKQAYDYLYNRVATMPEHERPIMFVKDDGKLYCPCATCQND